MTNQSEERTDLGVKAAQPAEASPVEAASATALSAAAPRLMGVKLPIRVLMGRTQMSLRDLAALGSGSVVELDCSPDDPVEIVVNDRVIAQGEIVVVGGNYGVRITGIVSGSEPLPSTTENDLLRLSERLK